MKSYRIFALALCSAALFSCAQNARVSGILEGAPDSELTVRHINSPDVVDTLKTRADGSFSFSVDVAEGQPEFIYLFRGGDRIAALLLSRGERVKLKADTLGTYTVSGSEESSRLQEVENAYSAFLKGMSSSDDPAQLSRIYVSHYRESVKYLMQNPYSLTVIPVLYESAGSLPLFSQPTDAIHFRNAADSLKTVYPNSSLVKALDKEASRREAVLKLNTMVGSATSLDYPDITAPDILGRKVSLSEVDAKVILLHFWDASDAAQKMLNNDLLDIYEEYHSKGLEIYSVCLSANKVEWAGVVKAQNLPWINVNDGQGTASGAVYSYNLKSVPATFIIAGSQIRTSDSSMSAKQLRAALKKLLK